MKNFKVCFFEKVVVSLSFLLVLSVCSSFAEENNKTIPGNCLVFNTNSFENNYERENYFRSLFGLCIENFCSYHYGWEDETVYIDMGDSCEYLSHLMWEENALFYAGMRIAGRVSGFKLSFCMKYCLPSYCGTMTDRDWMNRQVFSKNPSMNVDPSIISYLTNFSQHECSMNQAYNLGLTMGWEFSNRNFSFEPYLEGVYSYSFHSAKNGSGRYGNQIGTSGLFYPIDDEDSTHLYIENFSGCVIELERSWYELWMGLQFKVKSELRSSFSFGFAVNPFSYVESFDSHLSNDKYFYDLMSGAICIERKKNEAGEYDVSLKYDARKSLINGAKVNFEWAFALGKGELGLRIDLATSSVIGKTYKSTSDRKIGSGTLTTFAYEAGAEYYRLETSIFVRTML